jgi:hypothetical protein
MLDVSVAWTDGLESLVIDEEAETEGESATDRDAREDLT